MDQAPPVKVAAKAADKVGMLVLCTRPCNISMCALLLLPLMRSVWIVLTLPLRHAPKAVQRRSG
jgi:hypothetical protein